MENLVPARRDPKAMFLVFVRFDWFLGKSMILVCTDWNKSFAKTAAESEVRLHEDAVLVAAQSWAWRRYWLRAFFYISLEVALRCSISVAHPSNSSEQQQDSTRCDPLSLPLHLPCWQAVSLLKR